MDEITVTTTFGTIDERSRAQILADEFALLLADGVLLWCSSSRRPDDPRAVAILSTINDSLLDPRMGCKPWEK